jgi:hypothetical protein
MAQKDPVEKIQRQWGIATPKPPSGGDGYAVRRWLKGVGVISTLLGAAGLIQLMFWPSVCAIYLGLLLLIGDLCLERFNIYLRAFIGLTFVGIAVLFSIFIVSRKHPVFVDYQTQENRVLFVVRNDSSEDDYKNVDLTIWPDGDDGRIEVLDVRQSNAYPTARIVSSLPDHVNPKREGYPPESATVIATGNGTSYLFLPNNIHLYCDLLPRHTYVELTASLGTMSKEKTVPPKLPINLSVNVTNALIDGTFMGHYREVRLHARVNKR